MIALVMGSGLLGLAVGSFLNVVVYRVPRKESIVAPGSHCPRCNAAIAGRDNIPVVSWVLLKGRCRRCKAPISVRYPVVELGTAALFAGTAARLGANWALPATLCFVAGVLALAVVDADHMVLPKPIVYVTLALVAPLLTIASALDHDWRALVDAAACAIAWFIAFFLLNLAWPRALGYGDVRLALLLGLGLGWFSPWYPPLALFSGSAVGAIVGGALMVRQRMTRGQPIPFGVFLAVGSGIAIFAGPEVVDFLHSAGVA